MQSDFWGVNAFFRQTDRSGTPSLDPGQQQPEDAPTPHRVTLTDDAAPQRRRCSCSYERRDGSGGSPIPDDAQGPRAGPRTARSPSSKHARRDPKAARRAASFSPSGWSQHDNFAQAYVNRMWGHLFGRGLNKEPTVDDFSSNNEVVHPELLDYLAEEFAEVQLRPEEAAGVDLHERRVQPQPRRGEGDTRTRSSTRTSRGCR